MHRQVFIDDDPAHCGADGVPDVRVDKAMLPRWPTDPHLDKTSCLDSSVKDELSKLAQGSRGPGAQGNHVTAASTYGLVWSARYTRWVWQVTPWRSASASSGARSRAGAKLARST